MPGVRHMVAAIEEIFAPRIRGAIEAASCGKFPLGFGWKVFARPFRVSLGIAICDVDNWMHGEPFQGTRRTERMSPVRAFYKVPPAANIQSTRPFGLMNTTDPA